MAKAKEISADNGADAGFLLRLREAVAAAGGPSAVSKSSGIALSTLSDYLSGTEARFSRVVSLARACKVSLNWLGNGVEPDSSFDIPMLQPEFLKSKAHFWALFVLLRSCQEFHQQMKLSPTLAEVFEWISPSYIKAKDLPDLRIEFQPPTQD